MTSNAYARQTISILLLESGALTQQQTFFLTCSKRLATTILWEMTMIYFFLTLFSGLSNIASLDYEDLTYLSFAT